MEQFLYGLLVGVALGMWLAILLYTVAGKRREGLSLRRRKEQDAQLPAPDRDGRPADDFDDYDYAQHHPDDDPAPASPRVPDPPAEPVSAPVPSPDREKAQAEANDEAKDGDGDAYQGLVAKMDGDVAAAERLIDYEQQRAPAAPRAALIQNALDRLEHDPR